MGEKHTRNQKGFTLIELLMVITIIGVLVGIVAPAVGGTGNLGTEAQVESDGKEIQSAVDRYHNSATKPDQWPEQAFGTIYNNPDGGSRKFLDLDGDKISSFDFTHRELNTSETTTVWQADGTVLTVSFVPGFLLKAPNSIILENDEGLEDSSGDALSEFLWTLVLGEVGTESENRVVAIYRLDSTELDASGDVVAVYQRIF